MTVNEQQRIEDEYGPITLTTNNVGARMAEAADGDFWGAGRDDAEAIHHLYLAAFGCPVCGEDVFGDQQGWFHTVTMKPICEATGVTA